VAGTGAGTGRGGGEQAGLPGETGCRGAAVYAGSGIQANQLDGRQMMRKRLSGAGGDTCAMATTNAADDAADGEGQFLHAHTHTPWDMDQAQPARITDELRASLRSAANLREHASQIRRVQTARVWARGGLMGGGTVAGTYNTWVVGSRRFSSLLTDDRGDSRCVCVCVCIMCVCVCVRARARVCVCVCERERERERERLMKGILVHAG
jgi:hypothetical protein